MGAFVISPLPSFLLESLQTAGSLRSTGITPLRSYYRPLRHPLVFPPTSRCLRSYGFLFSTSFSADEEGFSSCFTHPCHRAVAITPPDCLAASASLRRSMLPSPHEGRLGLWGSHFEAISAFTFVTAR